MLYAQTTEQQKFIAMVSPLAANTMQQLVNLYKFNRAVVLGLPNQVMVNNRPQPFQQVSLKLTDRLAVIGTGLRDLLAASARHKAFVEGEVATAVASLGGFGAVNPTGEWGFVLADAAKAPDGTWTYSLPSLPFRYTDPATSQVYTVNITLAGDGSGTAAFTANSNPNSPSSSDPL